MEKTHLKHKKDAQKKINYSVLIISDTRFQEQVEKKESTDKTIPIIKEILENHEQNFISHKIVPDEKSKIKNALLKLMEDDNEIILTSGGTGIAKRDVTIEAIQSLFEKTLEGFGELFRYLSFKEIGSSAMLSRASAGIIGDKVVFCLPGSPNAVKLALEGLIIPEAGHLLNMLRK